MFSLHADDTMILFFAFSFHWFSDYDRNTIPVTFGTQTHNEGHYSTLRFDKNMFRQRMCVIFYWLEREILLFKLLIFLLNWINIRTHPARAQYIILSNADTKMNMSPALKKAVRRLINPNSLEKLTKAKFHAFCLFFLSINWMLQCCFCCLCSDFLASRHMEC